MDSNSKTSKIHNPFGSILRSLFFKALLLASAISILSLLYSLPNIDFGSIAPKTYHHDCVVDDSNNLTFTPGSYLFQSRILNTFWGSFDSFNCKKEISLVSSVVKKLMGQRLLLNSEAESLCIGEYSDIAVSTMQKLGFSNVINQRFISFNKKNFDQYREFSFDFVLAKDLVKVSVPALLVFEVERVLKPNGTGALLLEFDSDGVYSNNNNNINMIRIASQISSLLRFSTIVHAGVVNNHGLVVFKKKSISESVIESENKSSSLYHDDLPEDCKSVNFTKPLIKLMEPLVKERSYEKKTTYLPKFKDVSSGKKNLVYVNIGGEYDWFPESYPIDKEDFNVYFLHYNFSIMLSHVKGPRVTFVYHPELNENLKANVADTEHMDHYLGEDEEFDLVAWFKETVEDADFVVLMMNAGKVEMKFLKDIYENGVICFVDELFLNCSESGDGDSCMDIYNGLRSNGVFVHQWWNNELHQGSHQGE
ncbi:unnamed protein product [Trifolium pratense]|uniref:Uncharacterized protein n=1 Tax=Trifolium pratense TaxID=57577 RepID=A0ACB0KHB4_TRIPR|nr:unnamed protein product [Trifolium pratense]